MATSVVLLHGGGTSARQWDLVVERLAAPALALDVPGRGDRPADVATLTLAQAVDSLAADAGGPSGGPLVLVAHSSGCLLAPGLVGRLSGRVRRVILIAASVTEDGGTGLARSTRPAGSATRSTSMTSRWTGRAFARCPAATS